MGESLESDGGVAEASGIGGFEKIADLSSGCALRYGYYQKLYKIYDGMAYVSLRTIKSVTLVGM